MWWGTLGTVRPFSNFNPEQDAMEIQAALEKKGASPSRLQVGLDGVLLTTCVKLSQILCSWLRCGDPVEHPHQSEQRTETSGRQDVPRPDAKGKETNDPNTLTTLHFTD